VRPLVCNYYITLRCEGACEFCGVWQMKDMEGREEADLDAVKKNLRDLKKLGVVVMNFTGGEPLLRNDIAEILRFSKRQGFFNILTTDGTEYLSKAESVTPFIDHLVFSLDSPQASEHNRIRGADTYNAVIDGIKLSKKLGKLPIINFTVTRDTILEMPEMVDLAEKLGVLLWVNPVYNWGGLEGFESRSLGYITRYFGRKNVAFDLASLELIKNGGNNPRRPICRAASAAVTVLPDNTLVLPCFYYQKASFKIDGNLYETFKRREVRLSSPFSGRGEPCKGCMAWSYLNPSFLYGVDKNLFLALRSLWGLFWKELKLKGGILK
jgi:MoaA/NifB/PqqE/SkfB family radical SAM enzyme